MTTTRTLLSLAPLLAASCLLAAASAPAFAHGDPGTSTEPLRHQVAKVRHATRAFRDVQVAIDAGYAPFADKDGLCVSQPGQGAMGIHHLANGLIDDVLDPLAPEALMYQPHKDGRLELVGVEYIVFQEPWDVANPQPPVLFGHPFHLVREPNRYNVPAFYELHLWAWKHNRAGIFNDWNPAVTCPP